MTRILPLFASFLGGKKAVWLNSINPPAQLIWPAGADRLSDESVRIILSEENGLQDASSGNVRIIRNTSEPMVVCSLEASGQMIFLLPEEVLVPDPGTLMMVTGMVSRNLALLMKLPRASGSNLSLIAEYRLLHTIIDHVPDPIYVKDLAGRKILINKAEAELLNVSDMEEVIGKTDEVFYSPEVAAKTRREEEEIISSGIPSIFTEDKLINGKGEEIWVEGNKIPFFDSEGKVAGLVGISHDITRRKRAELELQENYRKYQVIFNSFIDLYYRTDLEGTIQVLSPSVRALAGYDPTELIGRKANLVYADPGDRQRIIEILLEKGTVNDFETTLIRKDGDFVPVSITSHLHYDELGRPDYIEGTIRDISERRASQEKLERMNRLQSLVIRLATGFINLPTGNSESAINELLAIVGRENQVDRVYIFSYDFKAGMMSNTYEWCAEGITAEIDNLREIPLDVFPQWVLTHQRGEMFTVEDVAKLEPESPLRQVLEPQGIRTLITIPMILNHQCLGFVGFDSVMKVKTWTTEEIFFLQLLSDVLCNVFDREQKDMELKSREAYLRSIFNNVPYQMWLKDREGRYVIVNQPFLDYFSIEDPDYVIGKRAQDLWPEEVSRELVFQDEEVIRTGQQSTKEVQLNFHGKRIWFEIYRAPIIDPNGNLLGTTGIARDVTKRILADQELKRATEAANAANIAKSRFLANMSHEIRTPLNAIIGILRLLQESPVNEAQMKLLHNMKASSENLVHIINDILDFSKIEIGKIELSSTPFNLKDLARRIYDAHEFKAEEKGIRFSCIVNPALDKTYLGDPVRLHQILSNLVSNAMKFTSEGMVEIKVDLTEGKGSRDRILFSVEDTGIGISPENQSRIFNSFQQEDESITRTYGGTGLGLAISKQLVELMGGRLELVSRKNQGSKFCFTIELSEGSGVVPEVQAELKKPDQNVLKGLRVLMVEDNKFNQFIAQAILDKWGVETTVLEDGQQAVDLLRTRSFDLILMDIQMPVMDGITATKIIRQELGVKTPILALTANVVMGIVERCLEAGMQGYISKPFEEDLLYDKILSILTVSDAEEKVCDISRLKKMVNDDPAMLNLMIRKFLDVTPEYILELQSAMQAKDVGLIHRMAHKIKSAIDLVAAQPLREQILLIHDESGEEGRKDPDAIEEQVIRFIQLFTLLEKQIMDEIPKT